MKTIVLERPGDFVRTETPPPEGPGPGEVEVLVHRVGICGTDLHAFRGRQPFFEYPRILGHELGAYGGVRCYGQCAVDERGV